MVKTCYIVRSREVFFSASFLLDQQGRGEEGSAAQISGDVVLVPVLLQTCYVSLSSSVDLSVKLRLEFNFKESFHLRQSESMVPRFLDFMDQQHFPRIYWAPM